MEEEWGWDPELDDPIVLGDLLACQVEDPSTIAARNIDWDAFLGSHDYRYGVIVKGMLEGGTLGDAAKACGTGYLGLQELRGRLADDLETFMGSTAILDSLRVPTWRANIMADREKASCKADRRRH